MTDIVERLRDISAGPSAELEKLGKEAADEIERLRAGGCARDQGTTQYCAEAAKLAAENERLRAALEMFACDCEGEAICLGNCMHRNARAALEVKG